MHTFYNFKGFSKAQLNLFEPLTVLIGPNGSGKSNVIEAVELFSFIAYGKPLHLISDYGNGSGEIRIRGGFQSCPRFGENSFRFQFTGKINFDKKDLPFSYCVKIQVSPQPRIIDESLSFDNGPLIFKTLEHTKSGSSGDIRVEYNNFASGGHKPIVDVSNDRSVLSRYGEFSKGKNKQYEKCLKVVNGIMFYLRSSFIFDPNPKLMRSYERIGNNILLRDGSNISAVLYDLKNDTKNPWKKESLLRIISWIKQLPEEPFKELNFVKTKLNDVILGFKESEESHFVDARVLSDGTLRSLAVLTALETVAPSSRVIIEELDNGLHPSRVNILVEAIVSCCKRRKLNVLVTTHNPATLNSLLPEQLDGVVLCDWDGENKTFRLVRLPDLPLYPQLLERGRLGDLITRRIVDQYLSPNFGEEQKQKALEWLENLP